MERRRFSEEQLAAIRERVPDFDEQRFTKYAGEFESSIRAVAEREGGQTAAVLRLTLPKAFGAENPEKHTVEDAARQTGLTLDAVLAIMQSAIHEAADHARDRAP
jgi:hypothetical protein